MTMPAGLVAFDRLISGINSASHLVAAFWLLFVAVLITLDVLSRSVLGAPFSGTAEIVANSVVAMVFLQLPSAVRSGGMLRAEILDTFASRRVLRWIEIFASVLGAVLFVAVAVSAWRPMVESWSIREFAGNESTIEIPLYPIRTLLVVTSLLAALNFLLMAFVRPAPSKE